MADTDKMRLAVAVLQMELGAARAVLIETLRVLAPTLDPAARTRLRASVQATLASLDQSLADTPESIAGTERAALLLNAVDEALGLPGDEPA